jgi:hypothetical protein
MSTTDVAYEPEVEANPSTFIQREKCNACGMRGYTTDMAYKITGPIPSPRYNLVFVGFACSDECKGDVIDAYHDNVDEAIEEGESR